MRRLDSGSGRSSPNSPQAAIDCIQWKLSQNNHQLCNLQCPLFGYIVVRITQLTTSYTSVTNSGRFQLWKLRASSSWWTLVITIQLLFSFSSKPNRWRAVIENACSSAGWVLTRPKIWVNTCRKKLPIKQQILLQFVPPLECYSQKKHPYIR